MHWMMRKVVAESKPVLISSKNNAEHHANVCQKSHRWILVLSSCGGMHI